MVKKTNVPVKISYSLLIHAGSYKNFLKKFEEQFPDMEITFVKKKATHYYVVIITDIKDNEYKKQDLYKLPIMALREEFSNYLFFKSIRTYNNVLRLMYHGKDNKEAPYNLFVDMLTPFEKYNFSEIDDTTKKVEYTNIDEKNIEVSTTIFGQSIVDKSTQIGIFNTNECIVDNINYNFIDIIKKQNLKIGII